MEQRIKANAFVLQLWNKRKKTYIIVPELWNERIKTNAFNSTIVDLTLLIITVSVVHVIQ